MRWGFYLMSVASFGVLASIYWNRGDRSWAIGMGVLAVAYLGYLLVSSREEKARHVHQVAVDMSAPKSTAQQKEILADLLETRRRLRTMRRTQLVTGVLVVWVALMMRTINAPLAFAILVLLIPLAVMVWRNTQQIRLIENGLRQRNLLD